MYNFKWKHLSELIIFYLGAADWARKTLKDHSKDKREHLYTREVRPAMIKIFTSVRGSRSASLKCRSGSILYLNVKSDLDPTFPFIRIRILLSFKRMRISDPPRLHFEHPPLHWERQRLHFEPFMLLILMRNRIRAQLSLYCGSMRIRIPNPESFDN
jgi:hypothetical protein